MKEPGQAKLCEAVVEAMTTNESFFFRDKTPFEHFTDTMLPKMMEARSRERRLRIWCAAASTGRNPIRWRCASRSRRPSWPAGASRSSAPTSPTRCWTRREPGVYSQFEVQRGLPINNLLKYFTQNGDTWQISSALRGMVQYRKLNLLENFSSLGQFDIVFCRNVLIYFDNPTKIDILGRVSKMMPADGFLVLGAAETVVGLTDAFKPMTDKRGLYLTNGGQAATQPTAQRYGPPAPRLRRRPRPRPSAPRVSPWCADLSQGRFLRRRPRAPFRYRARSSAARADRRRGCSAGLAVFVRVD